MARRPALVRLWVILMLLHVLLPQAHAAPEYSIKAAYMLLFTRYVEWPKEAFGGPKAPIVICVAGTDPFGPVLDQTTEGLQSQDRNLSVRRLSSIEEAASCHLVYISPMEANLQKQWLTALENRPVLTVTDDRNAFQEGAMVWFVRETMRGEARIRFEVSLPAAHRSGLKVSAQMLVAARRVHRADA